MLDCWDVNSIIKSWSFECYYQTQQAINNIINKVKETGSVKDKESGKTKTEDTCYNREKNINYVGKYRNKV